MANIAKKEKYDEEILTWIATKIRTPDFGHCLFNEIKYALDGKQQTLFAIIDVAHRCVEIADVLRFHLSTQRKTISYLKEIAEYKREG
jgi:hypothetical protein